MTAEPSAGKDAGRAAGSAGGTAAGSAAGSYAGAADAHLDLRGRLSYGQYLGLDALLSAQHPRSDAHDELLFIIQHQTTELWLKLLLHELNTVARLVGADDLGPAFKSLARVDRVLQGLVASWDVLTTMTPADYGRFRAALDTSSGFQSFQFRELEFVLGNRNAVYLEPFRHEPELFARLEGILHQPSLYDRVQLRNGRGRGEATADQHDRRPPRGGRLQLAPGRPGADRRRLRPGGSTHLTGRRALTPARVLVFRHMAGNAAANRRRLVWSRRRRRSAPPGRFDRARRQAGGAGCISAPTCMATSSAAFGCCKPRPARIFRASWRACSTNNSACTACRRLVRIEQVHMCTGSIVLESRDVVTLQAQLPPFRI